jgi:2-dehydro-3-deoxy-D-arabinonate dehydratase
VPDVLRLANTRRGVLVERSGRWLPVPGQPWDALVTRDDLPEFLAGLGGDGSAAVDAPTPDDLLAPIGTQEVWAAGVTYFRSRTARMEEARAAGGGDFYDRVYGADRPELFFKASPHRVVGPGAAVRVRRDSRWSVPEPELALVVTPRGRIVGYTVGNDMSARDIEGENPLYLPQAKVYSACCALGPVVLVSGTPLPAETPISLEIARGGEVVVRGSTTLAAMKRTPGELVGYLFRDNEFPAGCVLLTGTGVVPPDEFALADGDLVRITIDPIGTLENPVTHPR